MNRVNAGSSRVSDQHHLALPAGAGSAADDRVEAVAGRARSSSAPRGRSVDSAFPITDFQAAVNEVDLPAIRAILSAQGFSSLDLDLLGSKLVRMPSLYDPRADAPIERDVLVDALWTTAITHSTPCYLPALPPFAENRDNRTSELTQLALNRLCQKKDSDSFDVFRIVIKKFRPANAAELVRIAYGVMTVIGVRQLTAQMPVTFPEYPIEAGNQDLDEKEAFDFPSQEFLTCLNSLDSGSLCRILLENGWQPSDLDIVVGYVETLKRERVRFGRSIEAAESNALRSLDEICVHLIVEGLRNRRVSLLQFLDLLPPFDSFSRDIHARSVLSESEEALARAPDDEFYIAAHAAISQKYGQNLEQGPPENLGIEPPGGLD